MSSSIVSDINQIILDIGILEQSKKELINKKKSEIDKILKAKKDKEAELNNIKAFKTEFNNLSDKETKAITELDHIQNSQCPSCMQVWVASSANEAIVKIKASLIIIKDRKIVLETEINKEDSVNDTLAKLDLVYKKVEGTDSTIDINSQIDSKKAEMAVLTAQRQSILQEITNANNAANNEYKAKINEINSRFFIEESALDNKHKDLSSQIKQINTDWANYDNAIRDFETNCQLIASNSLKTQKEYKEVEKEIDNIRKSVNIGSEAKRAIKSYTMNVFQDSLDSIGEHATRIINTTPNMATASIYFESAKENKDGKVKEEINGVLSVDGEENLSLSCLSGGESTSIELAVDLAFLDVVESRVKIGCDFYFADEIFNGLDAQNSVPIIELLKGLDSNKRIAIIDHSPDVKEMLDEQITTIKCPSEQKSSEQKTAHPIFKQFLYVSKVEILTK